MPSGIYKRTPHSEETKRKIGEANKIALKGNKIWLGKKHTEESKKKISKSRNGKCLGNTFGFTTEKLLGNKYRLGKIPWNKGLKGFRAGELNNLWKGGITPINEKIRKSSEYKLWKKSCFERDNFTCQKTGQRGGKLVVHHINNFADFPELRISIENGITLSVESHREFHKKYGIKNNTLEQLKEFLC